MYYVGKNGQQTGPFTLEQLRAMVASGQLAPADLLWTEGMTQWQPAASVAGVFPAQAGGVPPLPTGVMPPPAGARVSNYLWQSIAATLCCCPPTGVVAIIYATQVASKLGVGDIVGAQKASRQALLWCWISVALAIVSNVLSGILFLPKFLESLQGMSSGF